VEQRSIPSQVQPLWWADGPREKPMSDPKGVAEIVEACAKTVCVFCMEGIPVDLNVDNYYASHQHDGKRVWCKAAEMRRTVLRGDPTEALIAAPPEPTAILVAALEYIAHFNENDLRSAATLHWDMNGKAKEALAKWRALRGAARGPREPSEQR
jgi:hypothetical protein